jgi:hypothetical protein
MMNKEYTQNITNFKDLEKAINEWFNVFKWNISIGNEKLTSFESLSKFTYFVLWYFECHSNKLTSLEWCPQTVGWHFWCDNNNLTTLVGCPHTVGWAFSCSNNKLTSIEWCPHTVKWNFYCHNNQLMSVEKKKNWLFTQWEDIYLWALNENNLKNLSNVDFELWEWKIMKEYYDSFIIFTQSTIKLDKKDITETDIIFKWKKFKRSVLKV